MALMSSHITMTNSEVLFANSGCLTQFTSLLPLLSATGGNETHQQPEIYWKTFSLSCPSLH